MRNAHSLAMLGFASAMTLCACVPDLNAEASGPGCDDQPTTIASLDEATPAGVTGRELLARALGEHAFTLQAPEQTGGHEVGFTPNSLGVTGTLTIAHTNGELRHVHSEEIPCTEKACPSIAVYCVDRLELDVEVSVVTADGAFADNFLATLVIDDPTDPDSNLDIDPASQPSNPAQIYIPLDGVARQGSFKVVDLNAPENAEDVEFRHGLDLRFSDSKLAQGELSGQISWVDGEAAMAGLVELYSLRPTAPGF